MKNKILSWVLAILAILIVFFALQWWQNKPSESPGFPEAPPAFSPNFPPDPSEQALDFLSEEKIQEQIELVSQQNDQKMMAKALKSGKVEDCQGISALELKQQCQDSLNYAPLIQKKDPSECQKLHSPALKLKCTDTITFQKAVEAKNRKQCEVISDEFLKTRCLDEVNFYLAQRESSSTACDAIVNTNQKTLCQEEMLLKSAISQNQSGLCEKIGTQTLKDQCLSVLQNNQAQAIQASAANQEAIKSSSEVQGLGRCELLMNEAKQKCEDEAYFQAAFEEKNLIYCNQIQNDERKTRCQTEQQAAIDHYYYKQALNSGKKNECYLINNKEVEELCLNSNS